MKLARTVVTVVLVLAGCGDAPDTGVSHGPVAGSNDSIDATDPTILRRPFTAQQIRGEMVPGLRVMIRITTPERETVERWSVLDADADFVEIEYAEVPDQGAGAGEVGSRRSSWIELRDHATFPAQRSTRERETMDTALGTFEGWMYRVQSEDGTRRDEFFFADEIPGAPLLMRTLENGDEVYRMEQFARLRPEAP